MKTPFCNDMPPLAAEPASLHLHRRMPRLLVWRRIRRIKKYASALMSRIAALEKEAE